MAIQPVLPECSNCCRQSDDHAICIADCQYGPIYICRICIPNPEKLHIDDSLRVIAWARSLVNFPCKLSVKGRGII